MLKQRRVSVQMEIYLLVNEKIFAWPLFAVCGLRLSALAVRGHTSQQVAHRRRGGGAKKEKKKEKVKQTIWPKVERHMFKISVSIVLCNFVMRDFYNEKRRQLRREREGAREQRNGWKVE